MENVKQTTRLPSERLSPIDAPYFEATAKGELQLQRCGPCGHWRFPPAAFCPKCMSYDYEWVPVSGQGTLWSWIVMHQPYFAKFRDKLPYNVAFIKLDEGPFMMSAIVEAQPGELSCDARVEVVFGEPEEDGARLPRFRLVRRD